MVRSVRRRVRSRFIETAQVREAVRQAKAASLEHCVRVRVCWDLDNTLVDSGALLRQGVALDQAIVDAPPVPNMLAFYDAVRAGIPGAHHFILTARSKTMRSATAGWFDRHALVTEESAVCLIPRPSAKPKVWRVLASGARLVIVDDLSFRHETGSPRLYDELIRQAQQTAISYVGKAEIDRIAANADAIENIVEETLRLLAR